MPVDLPVLLSVLVIVTALWLTERESLRFFFALAAVAALTSTLTLLTGDLARAAILSALLCVAVIGASMVKFHHSARTLIVADFPLAFAGSVPFFFSQYRRMMIGLISGAVFLTSSAIVALWLVRGPPLSVELRAFACGGALFACAIGYLGNGGAASFRLSITQPYGYFSTFVASLIDVQAWWPSRTLAPVELARDPLPLLPPVAAAQSTQPDIILIQHESVFDPRLFGLDIEPDIAAFLSPPGVHSGALNVEIYGGGSWQSEFSVLTGIPSALFGMDAYFLFKKGVGRFHHSLPRTLSALGYKTMLASSCRRGFLNYDAFYGAIGMHERVFSDDLPPPFDVARYEETFSDAQFLPAVLAAFADGIAVDPEPRFIYALTNFNHGPHNSRLATPGTFEDARAFAARTLPDPEYVEYYARLAETAATWAKLKAQLAARLPKRPMLIAHYGDHQPVMTRRIETQRHITADPKRTFQTFYAMECLNFEPSVLPAGELQIAGLGTALLQAAGLPLDAIDATQVGLFAPGIDDAKRQELQNRLLRTLVDQRLVDLTP